VRVVHVVYEPCALPVNLVDGPHRLCIAFVEVGLLHFITEFIFEGLNHGFDYFITWWRGL